MQRTCREGPYAWSHQHESANKNLYRAALQGFRMPYRWPAERAPTHGRISASRPTKTYIEQLCEDSGCHAEDLPRVMSDREEWPRRVMAIRATGATWWWWCVCNYSYLKIIIFFNTDTANTIQYCCLFPVTWCCPILILRQKYWHSQLAPSSTKKLAPNSHVPIFGIPDTTGWLVGFYGMSTHWVILCRIRFYLRTHFFFMNTIFTN